MTFEGDLSPNLLQPSESVDEMRRKNNRFIRHKWITLEPNKYSSINQSVSITTDWMFPAVRRKIITSISQFIDSTS
jgi:hypothetical protein